MKQPAEHVAAAEAAALAARYNHVRRGTMQATPPDAEELARRLLSHEARERQSADELTVAERVYDRLRERLMIPLGPTGFDALWTRAMHLAQQRFPGEALEAVAVPPTALQRLHAAVHGRDPAETRAILITAFASFIALLFTFIGEELGFRLIHQIWPEASGGEAPVPGEHVPQ